MIIKQVKLVNFRNRENFTLKCEDKLTSILGENGCGKTSILEAIYEALQGRSFRAVDREIVRRGADFYRVEVLYGNGEKVVVTYRAVAGENKSVEDKLAKSALADSVPAEKKFMVADRNFKRLPRKYKYPVVLFEPDDLNLVGASPSRRRDYFDRILGQLDAGYASLLNKYRKSLTQRNELLKKEDLGAEELFSWNVMLAKYGCEMRRKREKFVDLINEQLTEVYRSIAENDDEVLLKYSGEGVEFNEEQYLARLEELFDLERIFGFTRFGAHKDNYEFYFNGVEADGSASRGEVRSIIIALKFIEAKMILARTGKRPLILLDDVFSELDAERQQALMQNFKENQIILTGVG